VAGALTFTCAVCGEPATTVQILEVGEPPPMDPRNELGLDTSTRRLMVKTSGTGSFTTGLGDDEDPLFLWRSGDFRTIRSHDSQATGNYCFECEAWYCEAHSPIEKNIEPGGAPMFDWYWQSVCPRGHTRKFERW
jgi:hypothetical protein